MAVTQKPNALNRPSSAAARFLSHVYGVRRRIATAAAGVLVLGLGYHVVFGHNGLLVYRQKRMDAQTLNGELRMLTSENDRLRGHVDRLQSDPNAIEHVARDILHYTRPGEVVVMMTDTPVKR